MNHPRVSVLKITILFLYVASALGLAASRFPRFSERERLLTLLAFLLCSIGLVLHARLLGSALLAGGELTLANAVSLIGFQLALIGLLGALEPSLRGMSAGLLLLGAVFAMSGGPAEVTSSSGTDWQIRAHVLTSMFAYGLLTVGAIVAIYALIQDRRLSSGRLSEANYLFATHKELAELFQGCMEKGGFSRSGPVDQARMSTYMIGFYLQNDFAYHQFLNGQLEEKMWKRMEKDIPMFLSIPGMVEWWNRDKERFTPEFVAFVDQLLITFEPPAQFPTMGRRDADSSGEAE